MHPFKEKINFFQNIILALATATDMSVGLVSQYLYDCIRLNLNIH
jgi:hypothetical protein